MQSRDTTFLWASLVACPCQHWQQGGLTLLPLLKYLSGFFATYQPSHSATIVRASQLFATYQTRDIQLLNTLPPSLCTHTTFDALNLALKPMFSGNTLSNWCLFLFFFHTFLSWGEMAHRKGACKSCKYEQISRVIFFQHIYLFLMLLILHAVPKKVSLAFYVCCGYMVCVHH